MLLGVVVLALVVVMRGLTVVMRGGLVLRSSVVAWVASGEPTYDLNGSAQVNYASARSVASLSSASDPRCVLHGDTASESAHSGRKRLWRYARAIEIEQNEPDWA